MVAMGKTVGNQGFSIGYPEEIDGGAVLSEAELAEIEALDDNRGPVEIEEKKRADDIEVAAMLNFKNEKKKHDDYEEGIDELNGEIDRRYEEMGLC